MVVRKIRKTGITRRKKPYTTKSRYGRKRGSTLLGLFSGGKRTGVFSFIPFPRAIARTRGARWAKPRNR